MAKLSGLELDVPVTMEPGVTNKTSWYLAKFPLGKIPGFESRDGAFTLVESNAIAQYIAESGPKKQQLLGATAEERALVSQWIFFNELQFEPTIASLAEMLFHGRPHDAADLDRAAADLGRWLAYLEQHFAGGRTWLVRQEGEPSLADITVAATLWGAYLVYVDAEMRPQYPELLAFFERVKAIPGFQYLFSGGMVEKRPDPGR